MKRPFLWSVFKKITSSHIKVHKITFVCGWHSMSPCLKIETFPEYHNYDNLRSLNLNENL